jgi:hypothetical protein
LLLPLAPSSPLSPPRSPLLLLVGPLPRDARTPSLLIRFAPSSCTPFLLRLLALPLSPSLPTRSLLLLLAGPLSRSARLPALLLLLSLYS